MNTTTTGGTHQLVMIDPATLHIDTNVRKTSDLGEAFIENIKQRGVLTPILGYEDADGTVHVTAGQRRTLAAIQAGLATVPVYLQPKPGEQDTIIDQVNENIHRADLNHADFAGAVAELALFDLPAAEIAKSLSAPKEAVENALKATQGKTSAAALTKGLDLVQALTLEEFADDEEVLSELADIALSDPGQFAHRAEIARRQKERAKKEAELVAEAERRGLTVYKHSPEYSGVKPRPVNIHDLKRADGNPATEDDATGVYFAYGHPIYYVVDWKKAGLSKAGSLPGGGMTDADKAQRREVIENNRAMEAANTVRRDFITTLLKAKTLPKNAHRFIARILSDNTVDHTVLNETQTLLGIKTTLKAHAAKTTTKPEMVTLAIAIAVLESRIDKNTWRSCHSRDSYTIYQQHLKDWGYSAAPVELIPTTKK